MMEIGRVVVKTRGKEAGKSCVVVEVFDRNYVLIDGNVKRKKCNVSHLEPQPLRFEIEKGASTEEIKKLLKKHDLLDEKKIVTYKKREKAKSIPKKELKKEKAKPKAKKAKKTEDEIVEESLKASEE